jgi:hypothetical protein
MEALGEIGSQHADTRKQILPLLSGPLGKSNATTSAAINALKGLAQRSPNPMVRQAAAAAVRSLAGS